MCCEIQLYRWYPTRKICKHAPLSLVFFYATICSKHYRHLSISALPPAKSIGLITIPMALFCRVTSAAASTSATTTASALRELGLGLVPCVVKSSGMGGIPPARFVIHAPLFFVFFYATICSKYYRHLSIIALLPATVIGLITIPMALSCRVTSAATFISATTTASTLRELGLGLVNPFHVNRLGAFRHAMIRITAIETCINVMFLWNIPLI